MEEQISSIPGHKLCGFLTAVLSSSSSSSSSWLNSQSKTVKFGTILQFFSAGSDVVFESNSGVFLYLLNSSSVKSNSRYSTKKKKLKSPKKAGIGHGNGTVSVVQQLKSLVNQKCFKIVGRVVGISNADGCCDVRIAVLVDMYLPTALWDDGWQFPSSATTAASLFRHLRFVFQTLLYIVVIRSFN